jgi:hypothetical protein
MQVITLHTTFSPSLYRLTAAFASCEARSVSRSSDNFRFMRWAATIEDAIDAQDGEKNSFKPTDRVSKPDVGV